MIQDAGDGTAAAFRDIRFSWQEDTMWDSLDIHVDGPYLIVLYASVRQTNPPDRGSSEQA